MNTHLKTAPQFCIDSRWLWKLLSKGGSYTGWFKRRIDEDRWVRGEDFIESEPLRKGRGSRMKIRVVSLDAAKKLVMKRQNPGDLLKAIEGMAAAGGREETQELDLAADGLPAPAEPPAVDKPQASAAVQSSGCFELQLEALRDLHNSEVTALRIASSYLRDAKTKLEELLSESRKNEDSLAEENCRLKELLAAKEAELVASRIPLEPGQFHGDMALEDWFDATYQFHGHSAIIGRAILTAIGHLEKAVIPGCRVAQEVRANQKWVKKGLYAYKTHKAIKSPAKAAVEVPLPFGDRRKLVRHQLLVTPEGQKWLFRYFMESAPCSLRRMLHQQRDNTTLKRLRHRFLFPADFAGIQRLKPEQQARCILYGTEETEFFAFFRDACGVTYKGRGASLEMALQNLAENYTR